MKQARLFFLGLKLIVLIGFAAGSFFMQPLAAAPALVRSIAVPSGYQRASYPEGSFSRYLQDCALKPDNRIYAYNGSLVSSRYQVYAVVDAPLLFSGDLEQCADYCMRFWADYHRAVDKLDELFLFAYDGKKIYFGSQEAGFQEFLRTRMAYSNSHSLKAGGTAVAARDLEAGDMFVQNETGGIGHVSLIVDACRNGRGEKLFLIGFSFMPAQEFHIEKALFEFGSEGWFSCQGYIDFLKINYPYGEPSLRRFK